MRLCPVERLRAWCVEVRDFVSVFLRDLCFAAVFRAVFRVLLRAVLWCAAVAEVVWAASVGVGRRLALARSKKAAAAAHTIALPKDENFTAGIRIVAVSTLYRARASDQQRKQKMMSATLIVKWVLRQFLEQRPVWYAVMQEEQISGSSSGRGGVAEAGTDRG